MPVIDTQNSNPFESLGLAKPNEPKKKEEMGMDTFMKLMVTQLNNQDPMKPMNNEQMLSQIAQFTSVSGISELNNSFKDLTGSLANGQALQASSLVGREVYTPLNEGVLSNDSGINGSVQLDSSASNVLVRISDPLGRPVRQLQLGPQPAGELRFSWDGLDDQGEFSEPGRYQIQIEAQVGDETVALDPLVAARVDSVVVDNRGFGTTLNLVGLGPIDFKDVQQIH